jgi:hypothetical protein
MNGPSWVLIAADLQADHRAADHLRLKADFVDRAHHADRVRRIGADDHGFRIRRLDRANDRREVRGGRRIFPIVDHLDVVLLRVGPRAVAGVVRELGVSRDQRHGLDLVLGGDFEEALSEGRLGVLSRRDHRESISGS